MIRYVPTYIQYAPTYMYIQYNLQYIQKADVHATNKKEIGDECCFEKPELVRGEEKGHGARIKLS